MPDGIRGQTLERITRRAKYLLFRLEKGTLILHLGMSGSLRVVHPDQPLRTHDHIDLIFERERILRFNDPRRFGSVHWTPRDPLEHKLLQHLGPEPLDSEFDVDYLYRVTRRKSVSIKNLLMDSHIVVGVGNIYANEALFRARVRPTTPAGSIARVRLERIVVSVQAVLTEAISLGGTTLRDYIGSNGEPGYFKQELYVYGRSGERCLVCESKLKGIVLGQRQTVYCPSCQRR